MEQENKKNTEFIPLLTVYKEKGRRISVCLSVCMSDHNSGTQILIRKLIRTMFD